MSRGTRIAVSFVGVVVWLLPSAASAQAQFQFNNITGPDRTFGPGNGSATPGDFSYIVTTNQNATSTWSITTNFAINFIGGDARCILRDFAPNAPINAIPWTFDAGGSFVGGTAKFAWESPNTGATPISADYIVGFSSTATSGAQTRVFGGSINVKITGLVPEPAGATAVFVAVGLLGRRRARGVAGGGTRG